MTQRRVLPAVPCWWAQELEALRQADEARAAALEKQLAALAKQQFAAGQELHTARQAEKGLAGEISGARAQGRNLMHQVRLPRKSCSPLADAAGSAMAMMRCVGLLPVRQSCAGLRRCAQGFRGRGSPQCSAWC